MKITGIVSNTPDEGWVLEVTEPEYKRVMGVENWRLEKQIRATFPDEPMPWIIDMYTLVMKKGILYGNKVKMEIDFEKM